MWRQLRWDVLGVGLLIVGYLGYSFLQNPYVRAPDEATSEGQRPRERTEGDVVLLLPDAPGATAKNFDELDCSFGWYSALWQHYGSFATALSRNLSPEFLAGRSAVVVPSRVARSMPSNGLTALAAFARRGGIVVLEQPGEGWERLTGVSSTETPERAREITSVQGLDVHGRLRNHLPDVPLVGTLQPVPAMDPWPKGGSMLEVNGKPGLVARRHGDGLVYTFLFEFGCTITALQQGLPTEGMRVADETGLVPSARRAADDSMLTSDVPYADLLELAVFEKLSEFRPLPRLWPYPGGRAGAFMTVHPTPSRNKPSLGFLDYAHKQEGRSTALLASDRATRQVIRKIRKKGSDVGLLWVRGRSREPVVETLGLGPVRPLARQLSLRQQTTRLETKLPDQQSLRVVQNEEATHASDWTRTFRRMAAADLDVDVSYGPTEADQHGYLFGTGFPFFPVDRRGLPFPMLELPFVLRGPNLTRDRLRSMLASSKNFYHQSLVIDIPGDAMRTEPTAGLLLAYRDAFDLADEYDHWVATVGEFAQFLSARRRSVLTSQWDDDPGRLTISVNLIRAPVDSVEGGALPGIAIPRTYDGEQIDRIVVDGDPKSLAALQPTGTGYEQLLTLSPGRHTVSIFYHTPSDAESADAGR